MRLLFVVVIALLLCACVRACVGNGLCACVAGGPLTNVGGGEVDDATSVWILSSPLWTRAGDDRYISGATVPGNNATRALDNDRATKLQFTAEAGPNADPMWFAWDTGVCLQASGFRVFGSGTVGDVRTFRLSYSTSGISVRVFIFGHTPVLSPHVFRRV